VTTPDDGAGPRPHPLQEQLTEHLRSWVGSWPPPSSGPALTVVGHAGRSAPGWDGQVHPVTGVLRDDGRGVLGVDPAVAGLLHGGDVDPVLDAVPAALGTPGGVYRGAFRWTTAPAPAAELPDAGVWLPVGDPRVPPWLHPFGGEVLVTLEDDAYVAGVGLKRHDDHARELAVVTSEQARGRGLARRLVAQAARRVVDEGRVPTYLHAPDNEASARVAGASGFADRGWTVLGFFRS
jgi:GNAT superfamily N-acetyltransferase